MTICNYVKAYEYVLIYMHCSSIKCNAKYKNTDVHILVYTCIENYADIMQPTDCYPTITVQRCVSPHNWCMEPASAKKTLAVSVLKRVKHNYTPNCLKYRLQ